MSTDHLARLLEEERAEPLTWRDKAVQPAWYGRSVDEALTLTPALETLSTPMLTLDRSALDHNLHAMKDWCEAAGVSLAPHGKTTMAPALWREQLEAGAWAITVANEPQLRVARGAGVPRVVLANLLIRREALVWLGRELDADEDFTVICWVDSLDAVRTMDEALTGAGVRRRVPVLVEVGAPGARTGVRDRAQALEVARAVVAARGLELAGVAGYEGSVAHGTGDAALAAITAYLSVLVDVHRALLDDYEVAEPLLSAGGSAYPDLVRAVLAPEGRSETPRRPRVLLRSGAYLVHDDGYYRAVGPDSRGTGPRLRSAMHAWGRVLSVPEPGRAYLDVGRRDVPFDQGLPVPQQLRRRATSGEVATMVLEGHDVIALDDQHAHVRLPAGSPVRVGDVLRLGLSHPCTAFDKWSLIPIIDDAAADSPVVVDLVRCHF